ncbi:MAG: trypsin-like peptidase domain-containing protein [Eubacteriales bacterium]|nr:trypsin-like peptidase domain-containing protein [Eubacteriales bacterium]
MRQRSYIRSIIISSVICSILTGMFVYSYVTRNQSRSVPEGPTQEQDELDRQPGPQLISTEGGNNQSAGGIPGGNTGENTGGEIELTPVARVARSASQGVVGISVIIKDGNSLFQRDDTEKVGIGTGVIVSKDGYILTNDHVIAGNPSQIIVSLPDGTNAEGMVLWSNPVLDIAIVKIEKSNLIPIPLGDSDKIVVGETAIAIGNPLGLQFQRSVTSGVISAINRTIRIETEGGVNYMEDLIQTDASINPGNSGGPLLNARGEVIGINTVKVISAEAIGFAVPINIAIPIISSFVETGEFREPYMGVFAYDKETIPYMSGVSVDNGIYIASVDPKGPASKAGIKEGCVIRTVDGRTIDTMVQLRAYIYSKKPGDIITVNHLNQESSNWMDMKIQLGESPK